MFALSPGDVKELGILKSEEPGKYILFGEAQNFVVVKTSSSSKKLTIHAKAGPDFWLEMGPLHMLPSPVSRLVKSSEPQSPAELGADSHSTEYCKLELASTETEGGNLQKEQYYRNPGFSVPHFSSFSSGPSRTEIYFAFIFNTCRTNVKLMHLC